MRNLFLLGIVGLATAGSASFELLLVADGGNERIHRFDGSTGQYFGSFGAGDFSTGLRHPLAIAVMPSRGSCFVADFDRNLIHEYDYSTGLALNSFVFSGPRQIAVTSGNELLVAGGGGIRRLTPTGSVITTYSVANCSSTGFTSDGFVYGIEAIGTSLSRYTLAGAPAGTAVLPAPGGPFHWQIAGGANLGYYANPSADTITRFSSSNPPVLGTPFNSVGLSETRAVGLGHNDTVYIGGRDAGDLTKGFIENYIWPTSSTAPFLTRKIGVGILQDPIAIAVVVAPEPTTFVLLGVGALCLLRRKAR